MMLWIIRHGQTDRNRLRVLQGRSDEPLNDAGIAQARQAAAKLAGIRFERVITSPLRRAVQTAEIVAPGVRPLIDDRLIEMDCGPYEGADLIRLPAEVLTFFRDFAHNPAPAGMEPLASVTARAGAFLADVRTLTGNILVSTHAIAMKGLLEVLTPDARGRYWSEPIGNCAIRTVRCEGGVFGLPEEMK